MAGSECRSRERTDSTNEQRRYSVRLRSEVPVGHVARLWIQWPTTASDSTSLSLWATGTIQRSAKLRGGVAIMLHEFRTRRTSGSTPSSLLVARSAR